MAHQHAQRPLLVARVRRAAGVAGLALTSCAQFTGAHSPALPASHAWYDASGLHDQPPRLPAAKIPEVTVTVGGGCWADELRSAVGPCGVAVTCAAAPPPSGDIP